MQDVGEEIGLLNVFSHQHYREVIDNLSALARVWREVSIPQALRNLLVEPDGQGWSAGFSELIAKPSDRSQFRVDLERLLQSSSNDEQFRKNSSGGAASDLLPERMIDKLVRWSQTALDAISVLFGFAFVGWVEMRNFAMLTSKGEESP